jgi:hypothetical protein
VAPAAALTLLLGGFASADAQIYEWLDQAKGRHFANSLERVPPEARGSAKVVVSSVSTQRAGETPADESESSETDRSDDTDLEEEVFETAWDEGFLAGWDAGFRAANEEQLASPPEPVIVLVDDQPPVAVNLPRYDPTGAYYLSPYSMTVTVPFDDGASRGLTRRQLAQDLRSIERGW